MKNFFKKLLLHKWVLIIVLSVLVVGGGGAITTVSIINYKHTPVYKGMDLAKDTVADIVDYEEEASSKGGLMRLGMHTIGEDDQGENEDEDEMQRRHRQKDFEDQIEDSIDVVIPEGISIYAKPGETINVTVHISNPMFYEILSFTLNGRLYQTYEFQEGSDSETIIVKFTVSEDSGLEEITIDAIKYVDGSNIKSARFEADKTLKIGVEYLDVPFVSNVAEIINTTSFGVSFMLTDNNHLMDTETGIWMYVFNGEKICYTSKLNLGQNVFPYTNMQMGATYNYAIVGVYDSYDGRGKGSNVLYSSEITTKEGLSFDQIEVSYDALTIDFVETNSGSKEATIVSIDLLLGDQVIDTISGENESYVFSGLLSNNEYTLNATYSYDITENGAVVTYNKTIKTLVSTLQRPTPEVQFINTTCGQESVTFEYDIQNETTETSAIKSLGLYKGEELVRELDPKALEVDNLLSNNDYILKAVYEYDLYDGTGKHELNLEVAFHTLAKVAPVFEFTSSDKSSSTIDYAISLNDVDGTCTEYQVGLWKLLPGANDDELVATKDSLEGTFDNLQSNTKYEVYLAYNYDLNDGEGVREADLSLEVTTDVVSTPYVNITNGIGFLGTMTVSFSVVDPTNLITIQEFRLYSVSNEGGNEVLTLISSTTEYDNNNQASLSYTDNNLEYRVYVIYTYDLNDGNGSHVIDENAIIEHSNKFNCAVVG